MAGGCRLIAGLGNPGKRYEYTRHNIGALVIKAFVQRYSRALTREEKLKALATHFCVEETLLHLVVPTTYMNESGIAIRRYLSYYRLTVADLVVVVDDVALPFGSLRLRQGGSAGGHNGLKSIEGELSSREYARLRLGVGAPPPGQELGDYVLASFSSEEMGKLPEILSKAVAALHCLLTHSVEIAMNLVNCKDWQWSQT